MRGGGDDDVFVDVQREILKGYKRLITKKVRKEGIKGKATNHFSVSILHLLN